EIRRQTSLDLRKVARALHPGLRILLPTLRIVEREVDVVLGQFSVELVLRIYKLDRICRWIIGRRLLFYVCFWRRGFARGVLGYRRRLGRRLGPAHEYIFSLFEDRPDHKPVGGSQRANSKHQQYCQDPQHQRQLGSLLRRRRHWSLGHTWNRGSRRNGGSR